MSALDIVIANADIVDGGADAQVVSGDVGVLDGRIAALGDLTSRTRARTIDAGGRLVAPGFIDSHTHVEMASLTGHPDRYAPLLQGVTTTMVGADGFGWVGLQDEDANRWWQDMAAIYGPVPEQLPRWDDPAAFLAELEAKSPTSVVPLAPHGSVRAAVMGDRAGRADRSEMEGMRRLVADWMDAGAVGLASGLDYLPGRYADTGEISELCEMVADRGGVYASHLRLHDLGRAEAWGEATEIARRAGVPLRIAHERLDEEGAGLIDEAANLVDVTIDTYLYPAGCTSLAFHVPVEELADGVVSLSRRLEEDRELASRLADHLDRRLTGSPGQDAIIASTTSGRFEGRTLSSLATERGSTVGELAVDLLRDEMPCALLVYVWQRPDSVWDETVARTLADPRSIIATDGVYLGSSPHPRGFGTFPRVLGTFARERSLIPLPRAIHKMTGLPARAYGLEDRGRIEPGLRADLVVLDLERVEGPADWDHPRDPPKGVDLVMVAGRMLKDEETES